jgi:predicted enzyme related to lactoylglutathione lyase
MTKGCHSRGPRSSSKGTTKGANRSKQAHRIRWFEIPVTDREQSAALYGKTLGIERKREVLFGVPHAILMADGEAVPGPLISDPKRAPRRGTGTVVYLYATDGVAAALARAVEAGARVVQPTTDIARFGTMALIENLDGNVVGPRRYPCAPLRGPP